MQPKTSSSGIAGNPRRYRFCSSHPAAKPIACKPGAKRGFWKCPDCIGAAHQAARLNRLSPLAQLFERDGETWEEYAARRGQSEPTHSTDLEIVYRAALAKPARPTPAYHYD